MFLAKYDQTLKKSKLVFIKDLINFFGSTAKLKNLKTAESSTIVETVIAQLWLGNVFVMCTTYVSGRAEPWGQL